MLATRQVVHTVSEDIAPFGGLRKSLDYVHPRRRCVALAIAPCGLYRTRNAGGTCAPTMPAAPTTPPPPG